MSGWPGDAESEARRKGQQEGKGDMVWSQKMPSGWDCAPSPAGTRHLRKDLIKGRQKDWPVSHRMHSRKTGREPGVRHQLPSGTFSPPQSSGQALSVHCERPSWGVHELSTVSSLPASCCCSWVVACHFLGALWPVSLTGMAVRPGAKLASDGGGQRRPTRAWAAREWGTARTELHYPTLVTPTSCRLGPSTQAWPE